MHQPKPNQSCQPAAGNDATKNGFLSRLVVDMERERVVLLRKLNDLFARNRCLSVLEKSRQRPRQYLISFMSPNVKTGIVMCYLFTVCY